MLLNSWLTGLKCGVSGFRGERMSRRRVAGERGAKFPVSCVEQLENRACPSAVALLAAEDSFYAADVQAKVESTGLFSSVTTIDVRSSTPTLAELETYDSVLVWSNYSFADSNALGNNLADYIDAGHGVVLATFANAEPYAPRHLGGRWASGSYDVIAPTGYTYGSSLTLGAVAQPSHPIMTGVTNFAGGFYSFRGTGGLTAGSTLIASWSSGEPLVAEKTSFAGRDTTLNFWPPSSDVYGGAWLSSTQGALLIANALDYAVGGLRVASTDPASGSTVGGTPTEYVVNVSDPLVTNTVNADDFLVNGTPATGYSYTPGSTSITFTFATDPVTTQGLQTMHIAADAFTGSGDGDGVDEFNGSFRYDVLQLQVTSTVPGVGSVVQLPFTTLDLNFNEAYDLSSAAPSDFVLSRGSVSGISQVDADTLRLTLSGITAEGTLTGSMPAGVMTDLFGNPSAAASGSYILDFGTVPYPIPLKSEAPLGSLIYDPSVTGIIDPAGDTDNFTIDVDAGQTFTVLVTPDAGLRPTIELRDSANTLIGSSTGGSAGMEAILNAIPTGNAGTYTMTVSGAASTTGSYKLRVILNAAIENESHDGSTNNTQATAQNIDGSFIDLNVGTASRGAVSGNVENALTLYGSNRNAQFLEVNLATGSATVIASNVNFGRGYTDLARNPVTGVLYGTGARGDSGFYSVNPTTGTGTLIGNPSSGVHSLAWSLDGTTLYAVSFSTFGTINPGTGAFTPRSSAPDFVHGMDFQPGTGTLYATVGRFSGNLYTVDPSTGAFSAVTSLNRLYFSLEFLADGTMLAGGSDGGLYTIDPATWTQTLVGYTGTDVLLGLEGVPNLDAQDWYSFSMAAGQTTTLAVEGAGSALNLELVNSSGDVLATGASAANLDQVIGNFTAIAAGTYYAHVTRSVGKGDYNLVVTRDAAFDTEGNNGLASAQPLNGNQAALGAITGGRAFATGNGGSYLIGIDQATGAGTYIGPFGYGSTFAGAGAPDGTFYTIVDGFGGTPSLATVDLTTGAATPVGPLNAGHTIITLEVDAAGNLFTGDWNGTFYSVDKSTGQVTPIGPMGLFGLMDIVFDNSGTLWAVDQYNQLWTVDPVTGTGTYQSTISGTSGFVMGLLVDPADGTFYCTDWTSSSILYTIDPTTGVATSVGSGLGIYFAHGGDFAAGDGDWYSISVNAGDNLVFSTLTPFGDPQEPFEIHNLLDPAIVLYDPSGTQVADNDNGAADGKNASLTWTALISGTYSVQVIAAANTGEYVLSATGATGAPPSFNVTAVDPVDGFLTRFPPTQVTVDFNDSILLTSLDASDLTVDGVVATGLTIVDGNTITFFISESDEGTHTVHITAGAILDLQETPLDEFTSHYTIDLTSPRVVASSIQEGDVLPTGVLSYQVTFSEPMNTANLDASDFLLHGNIRGVDYGPASFSFDVTGTIVTVNYSGVPDDSYTLTLNSYDGAFEDLIGWDLDGEPVAWPIPLNQSGDGIEGGAFFVSFSLDVDAAGSAAYPTPLTPMAPAGSLIYDPTVTNTISPVGDTDSYTLNVDAGQTITVIVNSAAFQGTIQLHNPGGVLIGTATASAIGEDAVLQTVLAVTGGFYTVTVGDASGSTGLYTAQVILNAAVENESHGGSSNDVLITAQDLTGSSVGLGGGSDRLAVMGTFNGNNDLYSFHLDAGQSATLGLKLLTPAPTSLYSDRTDYGVASGSPLSVAYGDLNGDGFADMVTADYYGFDATVRLNNGDGTFGAASSVGYFAYYAFDVAVEDVNSDGNQDILLSNYYGNFSGGSVTVMLGNGDGTFGGPIGSYLGYYTPGLAVADFNGDGNLDVAQTSYYDNAVNIGFGDGTGAFNLAGSYATGSNPWQVAVGDLNGDSHPDLVTANDFGGFNGNGNISTLLNNGDGSLGGATAYFTAYDRTQGVTIGDLNGDGHPDVANTNGNSSNVAVLLNNGAGGLGSPSYYSTGIGPISVAMGDVNGDGIPDLATGNNYGSSASVLAGNGDGSFGSASSVSAGANPYDVALADLNGDGLADLSTANYGSGTVSVWLASISSVNVELLDAGGTVVASGVVGATNLDQAIENFVATAGGTYYARIVGTGIARDYALVVTRSATFDLENNNDAAHAQELLAGRTGGALGAIDSPGALQIGQNFEGLDANGSGGYLPPDTNAAVGNNFIVETVNIQIRMYDKTTGDILRDESLGSFFGAFSAGDPYVVYDDIDDRWYVAAFNSNASGLFLAVSDDGNPVDGSWTTFELTDVGGFPDYEKLGFNKDAIFISYNDFGGGGAAATVASIDKAAALSGSLVYYVSHPAFQFRAMPPAQMHGDTTGGVEWFVSTDGSESGGNTMRVTKLTNYLSNSPVYTYTSLPVTQYQSASRADQPGGSVTVFPNTTTTQVQYRNGHLVTAMASSTASDGFVYPKGLYYQIDVSSGTPILMQEGIIDPGPGVAVQMPSVDEDIHGNLGFSWIESSSTEYLSMWVGTLDTSGNFASTVAAAGGGFFPYNFRIGDYSTTVLDPDGTTFWSANEYIGEDGYSNIWKTRVTSFSLVPQVDDDWYAVTVGANNVLRFTTSTPADGLGEFVNLLDPHIELYDPDGLLVSMGTVLGDGRNERIEYLATVAGTYRVRVTSDGSTQGEYFLSATADAPLTAIGVNVSGVRGQLLDDVLVAKFSDADPGSLLSDFTATIHWGDGTSSVGSIVAVGGGNYIVRGDHTYTTDGSFVVSVLILDVLGSMASTTSTATISVVAVQIDSCDPTKTALVVGGTLGNDDIQFTSQGKSGDVKVMLNGVSLGTFHFSGRLIAYGQAGDDNIQVAGGISKSAWLYGGDGNDRLNGGNGPNVLVGGANNDQLTGGSNRDLMIGGTGADRIVGNAGEDILIAGTTSYDALDAALCAIMDEWTSARSYAARVANIGATGSGTRLNGNYFLKSSGPGQTVFDDGDQDTLTGSAGNDWFFANYLGGGVLDLLTDFSNGETRKDL